jgi:hypothetical protein
MLRPPEPLPELYQADGSAACLRELVVSHGAPPCRFRLILRAGLPIRVLCPNCGRLLCVKSRLARRGAAGVVKL